MHHPSLANAAASIGLFGSSAALAQHGLSLASLGALCGGIGTLVLALTSASREYREWRKPPGKQEKPA